MIETRTALADDQRYIMSLMRANRESVGGLPAPAIAERIARGTVMLSIVDGDPVGYVMYDIRGGVMRVPQACIQYDARRSKYGYALVSALLRKHTTIREVALRCAADLDANVFWRSVGFTCVGSSRGGRRRGRTINHWVMWLGSPGLLTLADLSVEPVAELRQDAMYDGSGYLRSLPVGFADGGVLPRIAWSNRAPAQITLGLDKSLR